MMSTYHDGDHLITFNWVKVKKNDVIVFRLGTRYLIKRVDKVSIRNIYISGDNKKMSVKLRPITPQQVVGRILLKY